MISIRKAIIEELEIINDLCNIVKEDLIRQNIYMWDDEYPNKSIFLESIKNNELFVATINDKIVGSVSISKDPISEFFWNEKKENANILKNKLYEKINISEKDTISLHRLFIDPNLEKQGIATLLTKYIIEKYNYFNIILFASAYNIKAKRIYERLGFINYGAYDFSFGNPEYYALIRKTIIDN